ncbi:Hypothetical protein CINCED_3A018346 [Cinara cedri]|uniref:Uncharacterized protein n=1 Tax=Cinara cedri TaxID=506608 RepID=A0A5E4M548_9HEMI|nr:Hypothetical protein CINCED_3A018346 [Cinara cedri]
MKIVNGPAVPLTAGCASFATSVAAACCFLTVWSYWYWELDAQCEAGRDCKCLLFGTSFASGNFVGGDQYACSYVYHSTIASSALAACASVYYGTKWLLCPDGRLREGRRPVRRSSNQPPATKSRISSLKICFVIILILMALNMFVVSIVISNGYISTCRQYVHQVKQFLMVTGNMERLVSNRLSCGTIYDFMDYLQPPSRQVTYELIHKHKSNPRDSVINTSEFLIVSIIMSWLNTVIWIIFAALTYYLK